MSVGGRDGERGREIEAVGETERWRGSEGGRKGRREGEGGGWMEGGREGEGRMHSRYHKSIVPLSYRNTARRR